MSLLNGMRESPATPDDSSIAQSIRKRKRSHEPDDIKYVDDGDNLQIAAKYNGAVSSLILDVYELLKRCVFILLRSLILKQLLFYLAISSLPIDALFLDKIPHLQSSSAPLPQLLMMATPQNESSSQLQMRKPRYLP